MKEFEIKFEKQNRLSGEHEILYEYVHAENENSAIARLHWIRGDLVEVLSVEEFV